MSRPSNLNTIHWQATTEPSFITKPRPSGWEKPGAKPKPTKKPATTKPHKPNYVKPKDPMINVINKTEDSSVSIHTTAATNTIGKWCLLNIPWMENQDSHNDQNVGKILLRDLQNM